VDVAERWNRQAAEGVLEALAFNAKNATLARYWLSLWDGDKPPTRGALNPAHMKEMLPGIAIMDCRPDESLRCRLAGSAIVAGLGVEVTGRDLVALTPQPFRKARLDRASQVVGGAISRRHQQYQSRAQGQVLVEDIYLPLSGIAEDGNRSILFHADWRPATLDRCHGEIVNGFDIAVGVEYFSLAPI
jgi:hypothetical protein